MSFLDKQMYVFDTETSIKSPISSKAHHAWPLNKIVYFGSAYSDDGALTYTEAHLHNAKTEFRSSVEAGSLIVGHNLKFDIPYLIKHGFLDVKDVYKLNIYDTQIGAYLLSAQHSSYPSLDEEAAKYGGSLKPSAIKEYWNAGIDTEDIPASEITPYLEGDVNNTLLVAQAQIKLIKQYGMEKLVESQMGALKSLIVMETVGMQVDVPYIKENIAKLAAEIEAAEAALLSTIGGTCWPQDDVEFIWSSPKHVSTIFFGGRLKYEKREHVGTYKNGKDKFKNVEYTVVVPCHTCGGAATYGAEPTKTGAYKVDDDVLKNIEYGGGHPVAAKLAATIRQLRVLSKQKETYYENLQSLVFPDGKVYPSLNQCLTKTGRLSCSKPNIQNQTEEGGIKRSYISRWGDEGVIVDFDYSQLEMAGLAIISQDEQLMYDINNGIDMHIELYREMYGRTPTSMERKKFKPLSFGLVYGAGYKTLALNAGCSEKEAKKFIEVFYNRYKGVANFHKSIIQEAEDNAKLTASHTDSGKPRKAFLKRMDTGRMYLYFQYDNEWKPDPTFSPTELKNWMVQGFSTGDIVPHMVGVVGKALAAAGYIDSAYPITTVHDSIVFDVRKDVMEEVVPYIHRVLSLTSEHVAAHFGIDMPVKLSVGCKVGPNWQDAEELTFD